MPNGGGRRVRGSLSRVRRILAGTFDFATGRSRTRLHRSGQSLLRSYAHIYADSVVAAVPGQDRTTNVYFKDYYRTYRRGGSITVNGRWELGEGDDNCAQCHKSGILPIFPVSGSVSRDEKPMVEVVNERFLQYVPARFDKYLDTTKFGPGLGSTMQNDLHSPAGASKTIAGNTTACAACHQPDRLGPLNWPMDRTLISSFVKGGQMPFGAKLKNLQRAQLYRKTIQGYFLTDDANPRVLNTWLLGKSR